MTRPFAASRGLDRREWLGVALVLVSALAFGAAPTLARFAYAGGSDPPSLVAMRFFTGGLAVWLFYLAHHGTLTIAALRDRLWALIFGVVMCIESWLYLEALTFISVSVTVLLFFSFPLMVTLIARFTEDEKLTPQRLGAFAAAFAGVALAVGATAERIDPRGVALALVAALGVAVTIAGTSRMMLRNGSVPVIAWMLIGAALTTIVLVAVRGGVTPPATALGWIGFVGTAVFFIGGIASFFSAVPMIGPVRAAMLSNAEPVVAIGLAVTLLGESLTGPQAAGAVLIVGAILVVSRQRPPEG